MNHREWKHTANKHWKLPSTVRCILFSELLKIWKNKYVIIYTAVVFERSMPRYLPVFLQMQNF